MIECACGCTTIELLIAMACCCLDEHFGLDEGNAALPTPHWRRRVDDDPLLELFSSDDRAVHVQSPTPSEEAIYDDDGRLPRAVVRV